MVSAIVCHKRGHEVTLYEKSDELGGNFKSDYLPDFKDDYRRYIAYLKRELYKTDVTIVMNHEVNFEHLCNNECDIIINASGASFKQITIEGLKSSKIANPFDLYLDKSFQNMRIAIVGGGLVGVEAALNIAKHGGKPFIIEKMGQIAQTAYPVNRQHLELLLKQYNIPIYINSSVIKVEGDTVLFKSDKEDRIRSEQFDLITECVGMKPNNDNIENQDNIINVGDAVHPENVMNAVWTAYRKCRLI